MVCGPRRSNCTKPPLTRALAGCSCGTNQRRRPFMSSIASRLRAVASFLLVAWLATPTTLAETTQATCAIGEICVTVLFCLDGQPFPQCASLPPDPLPPNESQRFRVLIERGSTGTCPIDGECQDNQDNCDCSGDGVTCGMNRVTIPYYGAGTQPAVDPRSPGWVGASSIPPGTIILLRGTNDSPKLLELWVTLPAGLTKGYEFPTIYGCSVIPAPGRNEITSRVPTTIGPGPQPIPTLGECGVLALALLLLGTGTILLHRRLRSRPT